MAEIRANSVEVVKLWQARCKIAGCDWRSLLAASYEGADLDRLAHLGEHRQEARDE